jgi:hypothetical protein
MKWTSLDPCTCLSESDSKVYNNFEFCEQFNNILIYKAKHFMLRKQFIFKKHACS